MGRDVNLRLNVVDGSPPPPLASQTAGLLLSLPPSLSLSMSLSALLSESSRARTSLTKSNTPAWGVRSPLSEHNPDNTPHRRLGGREAVSWANHPQTASQARIQDYAVYVRRKSPPRTRSRTSWVSSFIPAASIASQIVRARDILVICSPAPG